MKINPQISSVSELEPQQFIHGKAYIHPTGEVVSFNDSTWPIVCSVGSRATAYFRDVPAWLVRPAKLTVAHGWLERGRSVSWLMGCLTIFRRIGEWLPDFVGPLVSDLTVEHQTILQIRLDDELSRYDDTLEEQSRQVERTLNNREVRQTCRDFGLFGPKTIAMFVATFNLAATLSEEIDGIKVAFRLKKPKVLINVQRNVGSASPESVLSPQQIAELERALGRDLRRYEKARALLEREIGSLQIKGIGLTATPVFDLERYFGINGFREHTCDEIAQLRGLAPSTASNIPRRILRFLSPRIGPILATELLNLRSQFGNLRARKMFSEVQAAQAQILNVLSHADLSTRESRTFCLERYFGVNGQRIHSLLAIGKSLGLKTERSVLYHVHRSLSSLLGERKAKRLLKVRGRLRYYLSRAIKAQAVRLQLGVARRISAVLKTPAEPRIKVKTFEARRVVEIQFHAGKTWGDEGIDEWVPCVDAFGQIAEDAIRVAQALTKGLRQTATKDDKKLLFIIPDSSFDAAVPLSMKVLHEYIYTNQNGKDAGILRRYLLDDLAAFQFHHIRHTHSTHMIEEGGTIHDVAHYLGHTTFNGSPTMAGVFYLAGGTEAMRKQTTDALRKGAATGTLFDGIARLKIEAMGDAAKKANVRPNQLSFEDARRRVLSADILESVPADPEEVSKLLQQKVVYNITRWGGCLLQANTGHCPTANPCAIGIVSNGTPLKAGCGCKYLVLLPHSVDQLLADLAIMDAQLCEMTGEAWAEWRSHTEAKRDHWRSLLEIAQSWNEGPEEKVNPIADSGSA